jgi:hypothetical protein
MSRLKCDSLPGTEVEEDLLTAATFATIMEEGGNNSSEDEPCRSI